MEVTEKKQRRLFEDDNKPAVVAVRDAQYIAFAPYIFQASILLRDKGILSYVDNTRTNGCTIEEVTANVNMPYYGVRILMEAGLGIGLLVRRDGKYFLSKTGHVFINHPMARINTDFMRDVCYDGAKDLEASIMQGKPVGLRHLGPWDTIYQGLSILPEPAKTSWFAFDHYYSDQAFPEILPLVFERNPKKILDIGANTGKWATACLNYNSEVQMGLVDLQIQLDVAKKNLEAAGLADRATFHPHNILDNSLKLPEGYDVMFMSQFLDCFADREIVGILKKCYEALPENGSVFINETFWDCQRFDGSAFSLQMSSLYFTTMANGNSQMYDSQVYIKLIGETGFKIVRQVDNIGLSHTILELKK
ncbi:MAG: methyltransferase [Flavipsychrobacter sp.]|nr:methyltransferase [Flavipsychrobacter sp.]